MNSPSVIQIKIPENPTTHELDLLIPKLAKNKAALEEIERRVQNRPSHHKLILGDARDLSKIRDSTVHLVVTSPPYWLSLIHISEPTRPY